MPLLLRQLVCQALIRLRHRQMFLVNHQPILSLVAQHLILTHLHKRHLELQLLPSVHQHFLLHHHQQQHPLFLEHPQLLRLGPTPRHSQLGHLHPCLVVKAHLPNLVQTFLATPSQAYLTLLPLQMHSLVLVRIPPNLGKLVLLINQACSINLHLEAFSQAALHSHLMLRQVLDKQR
jgi:hypothetical protein